MEEKEKAFLEAHGLYADVLFRFCLFKLSNRELAKDLLQETFMKVWLYIAKGGNVENMKALLYKTVNNLIIDEYRKVDRRRGTSESLDVLHDAGFDPGFDDTRSWIDKLDGEGAMVLIAKVPAPYSEALFLRYVQDLSIDEIVAITGQSDNTISVRIHRGLLRLKELFDKEHIHHHHA